MGFSLWPPWLVQGWAFYIKGMFPFFLWITIAFSFPVCSLPFVWRFLQPQKSVVTPYALMGYITLIGTISFCPISSVYVCCVGLLKTDECLTHVYFPFTYSIHKHIIWLENSTTHQWQVIAIQILYWLDYYPYYLLGSPPVFLPGYFNFKMTRKSSSRLVAPTLLSIRTPLYAS